jgi:hypothetical protein
MKNVERELNFPQQADGVSEHSKSMYPTGVEYKNSKHEIRKSKQFQMTKICKIPNRLPSDSLFWIFRI